MLIPALVDTVTIRVETPDGTMFVHIDEFPELTPVAIRINIGKAGSPLMAWASCAADLITLLLKSNISIYEVLQEISNIHSDKLTYSSGIAIQSGPDGLVNAILLYLKHTEEIKFDAGITRTRKPFISHRRESPDGDSGDSR